MENEEEKKMNKGECLICGFISQLVVWLFDSLIISNIYFSGRICIIDFSTIGNSYLFFIAFCNYIFYLCINLIGFPLIYGIYNQLKHTDLIDKIQELINDNKFESSTIKYECYHTLQKNEAKYPHYRYIEIGDKPTKVITKSDIYEYNFLSMRDISGNIYFNTNRYSSNMRVKIQVSVEMDDETKKDFEDVKERFLSEYKTLDKNFSSRVIHNYTRRRPSDTFIIKVNGGKCECLFNKYLYGIMVFLGFAEIIKIIIRCFTNKNQIIHIRKIISSKYDVNDPFVSRNYGYDRLTPNLYVNDNLYENYSNKDHGMTPCDVTPSGFEALLTNN